MVKRPDKKHYGIGAGYGGPDLDIIGYHKALNEYIDYLESKVNNSVLNDVMKSKDFADGLIKVIKNCADYDIDKTYVDDGIACCIDEGQTANQVAKYLYNYFS